MSFSRLRTRALVGTVGVVLALALPLGLGATSASAASTAANPHTIAHSMMRTTKYRWTSAKQWSCLQTLWNRESGWRVRAGSVHGAYGIPQALPGLKMGRGWRTDATAQIRWGLSYIKGRYGSPCSAEHHQAVRGWY